MARGQHERSLVRTARCQQLPADDEKARRVVRPVLDVGVEFLQSVELGRGIAGDGRGTRFIAGATRTLRVAGCFLQLDVRQIFADPGATLPKGLRVRANTCNILKALLLALLTPIAQIKQFEANGDYTSRLAFLEEAKTLPFGPVWDHYCEMSGVPTGTDWLAEVKAYERTVLAKRS